MRNNRIKNCAFFLISCFCLNFGFAQKSKPNKNTKPAPVKPEAGTIKTNFIRFNCNQTLFDVPVDKQKIIIPEGQFYAKLKLLSPIKPGEADFGLEYAVLEPFKDTIFIRSINQFYLQDPKTKAYFAVSQNYHAKFHASKKKPAFIPENEKIYQISKGQIFKAVLYHLVDFDTINAGGRGSITGFYPTEITPLSKPFKTPTIINKDSFLAMVANPNFSFHNCPDNPNMRGFFVDSATSDTIRVTNSSMKPGLRILYKSKGSKSWTAINPDFHFYPYNGVIGTKNKLKYSNSIPYSTDVNFFYYTNKCWILPGQASTQEQFPNQKIPDGIAKTPFIPAKFFKKIK